MHPYRTLEELLNAFAGRVRRLESRFNAALSISGAEHDIQLAYCTIEAANAWAQFVRSYFLSCAVLRARTLSGARVSTGAVRYRTYDDALVAATRVIDPRLDPRTTNVTAKQEPNWAQKGEVRKIAATLHFSNIATVQRAFAISTTTYSDIVSVRNFYAHRSQLGAAKIRTLSKNRILRATRPSEFVAALLPQRPVRVYEQWLADFSTIAETLCH